MRSKGDGRTESESERGRVSVSTCPPLHFQEALRTLNPSGSATFTSVIRLLLDELWSGPHFTLELLLVYVSSVNDRTQPWCLLHLNHNTSVMRAWEPETPNTMFVSRYGSVLFLLSRLKEVCVYVQGRSWVPGISFRFGIFFLNLVSMSGSAWWQLVLNSG